MIWEAAGRPAPTEPVRGEGCCAHCGRQGPVSMRIGPNFTDYRLLADVTGTDMCVACSWALGGKPPRTLRMWSVVVRHDRPAPTAGPNVVHYDWIRIERIGPSHAPALDNPTDRYQAWQRWVAQHAGDWVASDEVTEWTLDDWSQDAPPTMRWLRDGDWKAAAVTESTLGRRYADDPRGESYVLRTASDQQIRRVKPKKAPPTEPVRAFAAGEYLHLCNRKDLTWVASTLADPPDGPWLVAVAESGQKHTAPFTAVNYGPGLWTIRTDGADITADPDIWRMLLGHSAILRANRPGPTGKPTPGFSAAAVESGEPPFVALKGDGLALWRRHAPVLAPWRGTPLLHLANYMITKETCDHYVTTYPVR